MSDKSAAKVRAVQTEAGPVVEIALQADTSLDKILVNPDLIKAVRRVGFGGIFGPRGCETCISGLDVILRPYQEVVDVDFE